jgi:nitrite reductase/ring-hydroxylating ferredoxin subunit/Fe-S cluster biogenesis protein NfuA
MTYLASEPVTEIRPELSPLERAAARMDRAVEQVNALEGDARKRALEMKSAFEEFNSLGLRSIVRRLKDDPNGKQLLFELIDQPEVYALLAMHKLLRPDIATRVKTVIERILPYLQTQGGDADLVEVTATTVTLKLSGACNGCSATAGILRGEIEEAVRQGVPEIAEVKVLSRDVSAPLITIETLLGNSKREKWAIGPAIVEIPEEKPFRFDIGETSLLFIRMRGRIQAFENACAHQGLPLERGFFDAEAGTITCPWHGFRFDCLTGECLTAPQAQLKTIPVRVANGGVEVRLQ